MASTANLPAFAEDFVLEEGFINATEASLGEDISEMRRRGFPYNSAYGLDFCKQHVLNEVCQYTNI